jgi:hypothetical protein
LLTEPSFSSGLVGNPLISNQSISQARTTELARSVEELRALGAVSQAVGSTLDLPVVLDTIVAKATQICGTEAGAIYALDERQREFQLRATYGMSEELIAAVRNMHAEISEAVGLLTETHKPSQQADLRDLPSTPANDTIQGLRLRSDHLNSVGQYLQNVCFAVLVLNSYVVRSSLPLPSWNSPGRIAAAVRTQVFVILVAQGWSHPRQSRWRNVPSTQLRDLASLALRRCGVDSRLLLNLVQARSTGTAMRERYA